MYTLLPDTDPILRQVAERVTVFDHELAEVCLLMYATMKGNHGVGLAAPQVGVSKRIIVTDISDAMMRVIINPEIVSATGEQNKEEGCLTFPDLFLRVKRNKTVAIKFQDLKGTPTTFTLTGLEAVIIQHEIDHLNGKLFVDHVTPMVLALARKNLHR
jgi:peptide deformylase